MVTAAEKEKVKKAVKVDWHEPFSETELAVRHKYFELAGPMPFRAVPRPEVVVAETEFPISRFNWPFTLRDWFQHADFRWLSPTDTDAAGDWIWKNIGDYWFDRPRQIHPIWGSSIVVCGNLPESRASRLRGAVTL